MRTVGKRVRCSLLALAVFASSTRTTRASAQPATGGGRSSLPLYWGGAEWVTSGTVTIDTRPHDQLSVRLEYRHDAAERPLYFGRDVQGDGGVAAPYVPNARTQDTITLGATAWF
jgi:hypothetical protein